MPSPKPCFSHSWATTVFEDLESNKVCLLLEDSHYWHQESLGCFMQWETELGSLWCVSGMQLTHRLYVHTCIFAFVCPSFVLIHTFFLLLPSHACVASVWPSFTLVCAWSFVWPLFGFIHDWSCHFWPWWGTLCALQPYISNTNLVYRWWSRKSPL